MSNKRVEIFKTCFYFSVKTEDLKGYESSEVILAGIPWKIKIDKRSIEDEEVIDLLLICLPQAELEKCDWICEADATITLCSVEQEIHNKELASKEFTKGRLFSTLLEFIKCSELEQYVQNGLLVFEVTLRANPIRYIIGTNIEQYRSTFRFTVEDVSILEVKHSPEIILRGTRFSVKVRKGKESLEIYLCDKRDPRNRNWTWSVKCSFKLLSFDENVQPVVRTMNTVFGYGLYDWGYNYLVTWDDFVNPSKKYVQNDEAVFEIDLEVEPPKPIMRSYLKPSKPSDPILECSICLQSVIGRVPTTTKCGHLFCSDCINPSIEEHQKCPLCNTDAILTDLRPINI